MGRTTAAKSTEARRAEWLLDRIRRGQFEDLDGLSVADLDKIANQAERAYAAMPEEREVDRGRLMLLHGRAKLELQSRRNRAKKPSPGTARRKGEPTPGRVLAMMGAEEFGAYCDESARMTLKGKRKKRGAAMAARGRA